jgi:hypothetical protein
MKWNAVGGTIEAVLCEIEQLHRAKAFWVAAPSWWQCMAIAPARIAQRPLASQQEHALFNEGAKPPGTIPARRVNSARLATDLRIISR